MTRLLIGGVLALALAIWVMRQFAGTSETSTPAGATNTVEDARQDINEAVNREMERAKDLNQQ